ncbi:hypothetical protein RND71_042137 [Anisodus tanguticus]|uniref:Uncharacterized protein n=1 Tax=Anisodus tanguticus TaxID=243964 RepID=A0AAE1QQD7_9SOLA|nr:hypothetical protein RND71_042137 [Anisodus tanguticus]
MERKNFGLFFVLLMIFASQMGIMMPQVEARVCMSPSHGYHGPCLRDTIVLLFAEMKASLVVTVLAYNASAIALSSVNFF